MTLPAADVVTDLAPTGVLRASINLGNPVLAHGSPDAPSGVTADIAREVASRLGIPVQFSCFDAARKSFEAMAEGRADICFLAIEPARESVVAFTAPYVVIEGVFVVPDDSPLGAPADVDPGRSAHRGSRKARRTTCFCRARCSGLTWRGGKRESTSSES